MEPGHPSRATLAAVEAGLPLLKTKRMLLLWGLKDFCFDATFLAGFEKHFPQAQKLIFPAAGHYVLEDAGEAAIGPAADFFGQL